MEPGEFLSLCYLLAAADCVAVADVNYSVVQNIHKLLSFSIINY